jgi:hypothetical protein
MTYDAAEFETSELVAGQPIGGTALRSGAKRAAPSPVETTEEPPTLAAALHQHPASSSTVTIRVTCDTARLNCRAPCQNPYQVRGAARLCAKRGAAVVLPDPTTWPSFPGKDDLSLYLWGTYQTQHYFCRQCGIFFTIIDTPILWTATPSPRRDCARTLRSRQYALVGWRKLFSILIIQGDQMIKSPPLRRC